MRDPNRIPIILQQIEKEWKKNPDIRFGQVLSTILDIKPLYVEEDIVGFTSKIDPYYLEDREFLKLFKKYFNE